MSTWSEECKGTLQARQGRGRPRRLGAGPALLEAAAASPPGARTGPWGSAVGEASFLRLSADRPPQGRRQRSEPRPSRDTVCLLACRFPAARVASSPPVLTPTAAGLTLRHSFLPAPGRSTAPGKRPDTVKVSLGPEGLPNTGAAVPQAPLVGPDAGGGRSWSGRGRGLQACAWAEAVGKAPVRRLETREPGWFRRGASVRSCARCTLGGPG